MWVKTNYKGIDKMGCVGEKTVFHCMKFYLIETTTQTKNVLKTGSFYWLKNAKIKNL